MYDVKLADLDHSRSQLFRLWSNLPISGDLDAKLRWFYRQGPHGDGRALLVQSNGEAVGCAGMGTRTLHVRGTRVRAALFADLAIAPSHRSGLPAMRLVRSLREQLGTGFDLGYGFPNSKAYPVYARAGFDLLGEMPRYVRVLRSRRYLRPYVGKLLSYPMAAVTDGALAAMAAIHASFQPGYELRWPSDFGPEFDDLWQEAAKEQSIACVRDRALLRWRFLDNPELEYRIVGAYDKATTRLRAYAVVRDGEQGTVEISDMLGANDDELHALLAHLVPALGRLGASAVCFRFLGNRKITKLLSAHGFSRRGDTRSVIVAPGRTRAELDVDSWYLTDLDEDI